MIYYCILCGKPKMNKSKYKHLKSVTHKILDESIISRHIILNPIINETDEIMKRCNNIYNKKYQQYSVCCVLNLLTTTNSVRYIRIITKLNLNYFFNFSKNSISSRINRDGFFL